MQASILALFFALIALIATVQGRPTLSPRESPDLVGSPPTLSDIPSTTGRIEVTCDAQGACFTHLPADWTILRGTRKAGEELETRDNAPGQAEVICNEQGHCTVHIPDGWRIVEGPRNGGRVQSEGPSQTPANPQEQWDEGQKMKALALPEDLGVECDGFGVCEIYQRAGPVYKTGR